MTQAMICRSAAYAKFDMRGHAPEKILAIWPAAPGAAVTEDDGAEVAEYFPALADPGYWAGIEQLTLGKSMHGWLPPVLLRALVRAGEIAAGRPLDAGHSDQPAATAAIERALAIWLAETVSRLGRGGPEPLDFNEFRYLVASGGHRAGALVKVLQALAPDKPFASVADVGTGLGMIPLLLAAEPALAVRSVCLIERRAKYVRPGEALWRLAHGPDLSFEYQESRAEVAALGAARDLIFFGQCFYLIEQSQRSDMVAAVSRALAEGGYLIVNDAVRPAPAAPDPDWDRRYPDCLTLPELIEELSKIGGVSVVRRTSDWQEPEDPRSLGAAEIGLDSFFVARRR